MLPSEFAPNRRTVAAATLTVAATYAYFLLFAQFGFLRQVQAVAGDSRAKVGPILAVMGLAGIGASWLAARVFSVENGGRDLGRALAGCGIVAAVAPAVNFRPGLYAAAALIGLGTGFATVTLACALRPAVGSERLGTVVGLGTGLAYGFCNVPLVFAAGATTQAVIAAAVALAGAGMTRWLALAAPREAPLGYDYSRAGLAGWVLVFLVLVALDSAAFAIIQQTPALKERTWTGAGRLEVNAAIHFVAAVLAGFALDRRWVGRTTLVGAGLLLVAVASMARGGRTVAAGSLFYTAGVSIYSTVLVFYPARGLRPRIAALVYGVAGWGGSAVGVGLAAGRHELPAGVVAAAALLIAGLLGLRKRQLQRSRWETPARG